MFKKMNQVGAISLVEVVVTSVVFSVAAFGIYATLSASRPQSVASSKKLEAAYVGKAAVEDLRRQIANDPNWNDPGGIFEPGVTHIYTLAPAGFTVTYALIDDPSYPVRRLDMNVTY